MQPDATRILAPNRDDLWGEVHKKRAIMLPLPSVHCGHSGVAVRAYSAARFGVGKGDLAIRQLSVSTGFTRGRPSTAATAFTRFARWHNCTASTAAAAATASAASAPTSAVPANRTQTGSQLAAMVDGWSVVPPPSSQPQAPSIAAQDLPPPQGGSEPDLKRGYLKVTQPGSGRHGTPSGVPGVGFGLGW